MTARQFLQGQDFSYTDDFDFIEADIWYARKRAAGVDPIDFYIRLVSCYIYIEDKEERNRRLSAFKKLTEDIQDFSGFKLAATPVIDRALKRCAVIDAVRGIFGTKRVVRLNVRTWENDPLINMLAGINVIGSMNPERRIFKKGGYYFYVDELCDPERERSELLRELEKADADAAYNRAALNDESFLSGAPLEVIEKRRIQLNDAEAARKNIAYKLKILG